GAGFPACDHDSRLQGLHHNKPSSSPNPSSNPLPPSSQPEKASRRRFWLLLLLLGAGGATLFIILLTRHPLADTLRGIAAAKYALLGILLLHAIQFIPETFAWFALLP